MQLPISVDFEPPTRADLVAVVATRRARLLLLALAVLLAGAAAGTAWWWTRPEEPDLRPGEAPLRVDSDPPGATVLIDGRPRGHTPLTLGLAPGGHAVLVQREGWLDERRQLGVGAEGASLHAVLWRRAPRVTRLRPAFPGSAIVGADFLRDGRVALVLALPAGEEQQLWLVDGAGGLERVGPTDATGPLAVAPDGSWVAYLARSVASVSVAPRFDELRLARAGDSRGERRWRVAAPDEQLADLAWLPAGDALLLVTTQRPPGGGARSRLLLMPLAGGDPRELVTLPGEVVAGSYAWSPDGSRVAFLARSGQLTALCLVDAGGAFRYLADVGRDDASPLPFPPVAWSPDGARLVYAAPLSDRPGGGGWLFGPPPTVGLYTAEAARPVGRRLGEAEGQSPLWRLDGSLLALARVDGESSLVLRAVQPDGATRDLGDLGLAPPTAYAARWDRAHAQALLAARPGATLGLGRPDYWLLRFGPEAER